MTFPCLKHKHNKEALLNPETFMAYQKSQGNGPKIIPNGVIMCYSRKLLDYVVNNYKLKKEKFYRDFYILKDTNNKVGVIGNFGIGAPVASVLLDELSALGVKRFISIGSAGSLQKQLKIGSIIVCNRAIRDEGTSYHYTAPSKYSYPTKSLMQKIERAIQKRDLEYVVGTTWTIDAPYRETLAEVKQYQKEDVLTVEMEASALFAVAKVKNVQVGSIFTISDYLGELEWKPKFHLSEKHLQTVFQIAKDVLSD